MNAGFLDVLLPPDYDPTEPVLTISGADGRTLLEIGPSPEYRWTVEPEDAPEAARIFATCVRGYFTGEVVSPAEHEQGHR